MKVIQNYVNQFSIYFERQHVSIFFNIYSIINCMFINTVQSNRLNYIFIKIKDYKTLIDIFLDYLYDYLAKNKYYVKFFL